MEETNPQAEVSAEDKFAAIFEKQGVKDTPNPEEVKEPEPEEVEETTDEAAETDDSDAEGTTEETAEAAEEVEFEGKAYKLPKELKDALLRQADYTRKTQEVADHRKTVEQQAAEVRMQAEFQQAHMPKLVELRTMEAQLQQYGQIDWPKLVESDPSQAMLLQIQQRDLQAKADAIRGDVQRLAQEHGQKAAELRQQAQARCIEQVRKEIKGFDADMLKGIDDTARTFGFTGEELSQVTDPRVVRVLHAAMQYQKLQGSKSIADKKVLNVKPVTVTTARTAQPNMQAKQMNDARARLKSTGRPADAEALLAARFARNMR